MRSTLLKLGLFSIVFAMLFSCTKDNPDELNGDQSEFGEVGNQIEWTVGQFGITNADMVVSKLENGISTFECSVTTTEEFQIDLLKMMPINRFPGSFTIVGNTVEAEVKGKITDNGMQAVFEDGTTLTLVKYDAEIGDKYTAKVGGVTLENEVIEKSVEDDYFWGGLLIKVITVRYKSHSPGINYVDHVYNHKFGLVGLAVHFEDGSVKYAGVEC
jgi:hypothetical protein